MTNVKITVYDGSYHDVDSSEIAFKIAGSRALREGLSNAKPVLLEPIMKVDILVPKEYLGEVLGNLTTRKADIVQIDSKSKVESIHAHVPLATMFGYSTSLRSATQGRATFTMEFSHFAPREGFNE